MTAETSTLRHPALGHARGRDLRGASLTDRQRLAVALQGVGLLGHLDRSGLVLDGGWESAQVTRGGCLTGVATRAGRDEDLPQRRAKRLVLELFSADRSVAGRGEARRSARLLLERWQQDLAPVVADRLVAQFFAAAPWLWQAEFGEARATLGASGGPGGEDLWVVGPRGFRRRLLRACPDLESLQSLLADSQCARFFAAAGSGRDPVALTREGRWRQALEAWAEDPPIGPDGRFELARALYAVGRFAAARESLRGLRRDPARILRLACQLKLGELAAVRRALGSWNGREVAPECRVDLASIAVRLFASLGQAASAAEWIERAVAVRQPEQRLRAQLLAGEAAWDRGELDEAERMLEVTASAATPDLQWRRSHLSALVAMARGDGGEVVRRVTEALRHRRVLRPFEAAGLWNDLAVGRSMAGDLVGAERALLHVVLLTGDGEGDRPTTLALCNLAEIRLRRGELQGVRDILERSARVNERAGNWRGWAQDRELEARYHLVRGRPGTAARCAEEALDELERRGVDWRRGQLQVLAARAHGWLGQGSAAREALACSSREERCELEPEERVPLLALAGERAGALEENPDGPCHELWRQLLLGGEPDWSVLDELEPYRAARFVWDATLLGVADVPGERLRRAAGALQVVGAAAMAERLVAGNDGPWDGLEAYLDSTDGDVVERLGRLFDRVSPEARLAWRDAESELDLVSGVGGGQLLERPLHGGSLRLQAPGIGRGERVAFALALRDLPAARVGSRPAMPRRRHGMIGESQALVSVLDRLSRLASGGMPVLICGETGTGKELAARLVHEGSARARAPFLPLNCAALAENLLLSELFGHVRGAFTGAERDRAGIFEAARGGTVFLDEIGDLPLEAQAKLLRVLQEGEVRRVGESVARGVDVRVVAATHRNLRDMVSEGGFREDLYYRLNVGTAELPPLRERGEDVLLLVEHFLAVEGRGTAPRLTRAARATLHNHSWPGNVRELRNVLTVGIALADGGPIDVDHLDLPREARAVRTGYHERVERFRRRLIREALEATGGNRAEAGRQLGLSRQALSYLVKQLQIH